MDDKKDVGARRDKAAEKEKESRAMRRANIAGENYVSPKEASPAYAPAETMASPKRRGQGEEAEDEKDARAMRRANIAGEVYQTPGKETRAPGKAQKRRG